LASWKLEKDCWTATTPIGPKPMCNIIATFNPSADHCLIDLAAHHESKFFTSQRFLGAIDSAAPVGIMLEIAHALTPLLEAKLSAVGSAGTPCLRLIFFDGEEAFVSWTEEDSLYGARWDTMTPANGHRLCVHSRERLEGEVGIRSLLHYIE